MGTKWKMSHSVDNSVENNGEEDVSIIESLEIEPINGKDGGVVVNVQQSQLVPLLAEDDEGCVLRSEKEDNKSVK